jgi:hypothetical protein
MLLATGWLVSHGCIIGTETDKLAGLMSQLELAI